MAKSRLLLRGFTNGDHAFEKSPWANQSRNASRSVLAAWGAIGRRYDAHV